jgi:hypothetical protein
MTFERVYAVTNFHDQPRDGVADFAGRPHFFQSEWDEAADEYANTFRLSPVSLEVVELVLEDRAIAERWWLAVRGTSTVMVPRALPDDRPRFAQLQQALKAALQIDPGDFVRARAEFRSGPGWDGVGFAPLEVWWQPL